VFSYAVIGGLTSIAGAISGVMFFRLLDFVLANNDSISSEAATIIRYTLSGAGLLFILYFLPGGLWQFVQRQRDKYLRWVADRHGIHVPSLVADRRVVDDEPVGEATHSEDETKVIAEALS
jgi:hypothetical protein